MFNVGGGELFVILLLALLVLGPERLPKAMGQVGRYVGQLRRLSSGFEDEIRRAMDDPGDVPFRPGEETLRGPVGAIDDEVRVVGGDDDVAPDEDLAARASDLEAEPQGPPEADPEPEPRPGPDVASGDDPTPAEPSVSRLGAEPTGAERTGDARASG